MNLLNKIPFIKATRRNHALEHATMKVLASRYHCGRMMGHSNPTGFILFADVPTELVTDAALEARKRLQDGEADLAIHPGCGTNLATSAFLSCLPERCGNWTRFSNINKGHRTAGCWIR